MVKKIRYIEIKYIRLTNNIDLNELVTCSNHLLYSSLSAYSRASLTPSAPSWSRTCPWLASTYNHFWSPFFYSRASLTPSAPSSSWSRTCPWPASNTTTSERLGVGIAWTSETKIISYEACCSKRLQLFGLVWKKKGYLCQKSRFASGAGICKNLTCLPHPPPTYRHAINTFSSNSR